MDDYLIRGLIVTHITSPVTIQHKKSLISLVYCVIIKVPNALPCHLLYEFGKYVWHTVVAQILLVQFCQAQFVK